MNIDSKVCEIGHGTLLKLEDKNFVLWVLLLKANKSSKLPWDWFLPWGFFYLLTLSICQLICKYFKEEQKIKSKYISFKSTWVQPVLLINMRDKIYETFYIQRHPLLLFAMRSSPRVSNLCVCIWLRRFFLGINEQSCC